MPVNHVTGRLLIPACFIICAGISSEAHAGPAYFSNATLSKLQALCSESKTFTTFGRKKLLLYHRDGYIPTVHFELPDAIRADTLDSAAAVLCLDDAVEEIEVCDFNIFFAVARERQRYVVDAIALADSANRLTGLHINGPAPAACDELDTIDSDTTSILGGPVTVSAVLDFISAAALDRKDNDRDGIRNLDEFRIGTDPEDAGSPGAQAAVRINGATSARIYAGDTAEIRLDLFPGTFLGNDADYYFWVDMPQGRHVLQFPAGLGPSSELRPALNAPLVSLVNFRLFNLRGLEIGDYQFHFEARDAHDSIEYGSAGLSVVADPCREEVQLPFSISANWDQDCMSVDGNADGFLARYYTFTLPSQSNLLLVLAGGEDAGIILRDGGSRNSAILGRSEFVPDSQTLSLALQAGTYTAEVMLEDSVPGISDFQFTGSEEVIPWQFTEVSAYAGINHQHGYLASDIDKDDPAYERILQGAGVAVADYDQDGWPDMYVTAGSAGANLLYRNNGDGTFTDMAETAGVAFTGRKDAGATFADVNGDGWPDLFLGGVNGTPPLLLLNNQDGTFTDFTRESGLGNISNAYSASFADYDKDGTVDVYISHWNDSRQGNYLFQNDGTGVFTDVSAQAGIPDGLMADYTPIFADINNDGWLDLLVAADFNTSQVFINNHDGTFTRTTDPLVITDDNGMGASAGDFDNDGYIDWFVTSIFDPNGLPDNEFSQGAAEATGNRLYRNRGNGTFEDVTEAAGVRFGSWGWGSCFADFNNDGFLDIFHVNGYVTGNFNNNASFLTDESRLFINNGDGTFSGYRQDLNLVDRGQGRGLACFDYDLDGDVDIFVANNQQAPALYRNDGGNDLNFLHLRIGGEALNSDAIGARIRVVTGTMTQLREIHAGNNFISTNPVDAYFGLGTHDVIDEVRITWPSGEEKILTNVKANQMLTVFK